MHLSDLQSGQGLTKIKGVGPRMAQQGKEKKSSFCCLEFESRVHENEIGRALWVGKMSLIALPC